MNDFVAYTTPWRIAKMELAAILLVMLGLWLAGMLGSPPSATHYPRFFVVAVGWFCVVVAGLGGLRAIPRLFATEEWLRVGPSGIRWRPWSGQTIPWSEVTSVWIWRFKGQECLVLNLRNRKRFPANGLRGVSAAADRILTAGDITISMSGTGRSAADALAAIAQFRDHTLRAARWSRSDD